jgi:hypothetical protein
MAVERCVVCGTPDGPFTRGRCRRDYVYLWRYGHDRPPEVDLRGTPRRCQALGCTTVTRLLTRGRCKRCYQRWRYRRQGDAQRAAEGVA